MRWRERWGVSTKQYRSYALVGIFVAVATICCREFIAASLPIDNPPFYIISTILAYAFGIVLSFSLQRLFTFYGRGRDRKWATFGRFCLVAVIGAISTSCLAPLFRYGMALDSFLGATAATGAFIAAAFLSSVVTYVLSVQFVFRRARE